MKLSGNKLSEHCQKLQKKPLHLNTFIYLFHLCALFSAAEAEVQESEPARLTPPLYRVQHPFVRFSGGMLISLISSEDEDEQPKCVIASVQVS